MSSAAFSSAFSAPPKFSWVQPAPPVRTASRSKIGIKACCGKYGVMVDEATTLASLVSFSLNAESLSKDNETDGARSVTDNSKKKRRSNRQRGIGRVLKMQRHAEENRRKFGLGNDV